MQKRYVTLCLVLTILMIQTTIAQNFEDDPEVAEIRARVVDISWDISSRLVMTGDGEGENSIVEFTVSIELWNPYDTGLTSYGSSSCRWPTGMETTLEGSPEFLVVCTSDYAPRTYPSGLSNETSSGELVLENQTRTTLPEGSFLFSAGQANYGNGSDGYFGLNMTVSEDVTLYSYETYPTNWGEILYHKSDAFVLDSHLGWGIPLLLLPAVGRRHYLSHPDNNHRDLNFS